MKIEALRKLKKSLSKKTVILCCFIFSVICDNTVVAKIDNDKQLPSKFFEGKTKIPDPFSLRDPFSVPIMKRKQSSKKQINKIRGEINVEEFLKTIDLSSVVIVGVLLGKDRRAIMRIFEETSQGISKETYILKEGMKVGPEGSELKAILPGGVVFVEKLKNVYDEEEYIETVIPISK